MQFNPWKENAVVSCGVKHIKFWTVSGNTLSAKKGVFGKVGEIQTMLCVAFARDGVTFSGTLSGDIYMWRDNSLIKVFHSAHEVTSRSVELYEIHLLQKKYKMMEVLKNTAAAWHGSYAETGH